MAYTLRIRCRASDDHSLAIVDGEVILTNADPNDDRQARNALLCLVTRPFLTWLCHACVICFLCARPFCAFPFPPTTFDVALVQGREVR